MQGKASYAIKESDKCLLFLPILLLEFIKHFMGLGGLFASIMCGFLWPTILLSSPAVVRILVPPLPRGVTPGKFLRLLSPSAVSSVQPLHLIHKVDVRTKEIICAKFLGLCLPCV